MITQEQQTQNIQSQEQKNRNPKYSKICTQILPQKSIVHKHQPRSECFFFLSFFMFLSGADLRLVQIQWCRFCLLKTSSTVSHHQPQHQNDIIHLLGHSSNDAIPTTKRLLSHPVSSSSSSIVSRQLVVVRGRAWSLQPWAYGQIEESVLFYLAMGVWDLAFVIGFFFHFSLFVLGVCVDGGKRIGLLLVLLKMD